MRIFRIQAVLALSATLLLPPAAWAALGGDSASVSADGTPVGTPHQFAAGGANSPITDQAVLAVDGDVVHEYSAAGVVFALTWTGPAMPNMAQLLGTHYPDFAAARDQRGPVARRAPLAVRGNAVVVHAWGHMGSFGGSAYVPARVPAGLDLRSIGVQP